MASMARPSLLRRAALSAPSGPMFSTRSPISQALRPAFVTPASAVLPRRSSILQTSRSALTAYKAAAFQTSAQRGILPAGPQKISGTVNDPAPVPSPSPTHGSYHWDFERALSVGLVPLTIAPFAAGSLNPVVDAVFIAAILIHSHIGFQAIIIDYIPNWNYPTARRVFMWLLNLATVVVGVGFYEFETNDVGLTEGIKRIWKA